VRSADVSTVQHNLHVRIAVVPGDGTAGLLAWLRDDGTAEGQPQHVPDLAAAVASAERSGAVRWVWRSTRLLYPALLRAAVPVRRCHDIELTGALLATRDGPAGQPTDAVARPADAPQQG
jgi:DNA polymerase I